MSGGFFDYSQYRINDAVHDIEEKLKRNNVTIIDFWNKASDDEKDALSDYERPWTLQRHPYWLDDEASDKAYKTMGISSIDAYVNRTDKFSKKELETWNKIRLETLQKLIDEHNNSPIGSTYPEEVVEKIRSMIPQLIKARIYLDRIDWLFSGDDGCDSFLRRVDEDLKEEGLENG